MEALKRLLGFHTARPERVPTDTVIPLFNHDDTFAFKNIAFEFTMHFDEVLDADKLADALWRLIEKPGWRKLGARLRVNNEGKLEYHVPAQFSKERPPIKFSKAAYDISVTEHPVTANLPRGKGKLEAFDVKEPLRETLQLKNNMQLLTDWTNADVGQLGLHVCTFTDATFVTVTWIHTLLDAMGRRLLFNAWTAMLNGQEKDVPDIYGYDFDPLDKLGVAPDGVAADSQPPKIEQHVLESKRLRGLPFLKFVFNMIWELLFYRKEHGRMICIPGSYLSTLRARAFQDLETLDPSLITLNSSTGKPFLSDGDILCAWTTRLIARSNPNLVAPAAATRTQLVINVFGMRELLSHPSDGYPAILPPDKTYMANCAAAISSLFTVRDFLTLPLGHIAARLRHDLTLQGTRAQIEALHRLGRTKNGGYEGPLFGTGDMALSAFSNWTKAKLYDADFSGAIIKEATGGPKEAHRRGRPVYIHADSTMGKGFSVRGSANCVGKDGDGNFWVGAMMREEFLGNLEKEVEEMRREEYGDAEDR